jgi:hypothetical protein
LYQAYILRLMENVISKLGFEVKDIDEYETLRNRIQILEFACKLDHTDCVKNTLALFRNFVDNSIR